MKTHTLAADSLRAAFSTFPTGVVAVCGIDREGSPAGMAVSSFVPISLDPPLVGISVQKSSRTWPGLRDIPLLGISVLSADHTDLARQLAARTGDRFADVATRVTDRGAVLIDGAAATFECRLTQEVDAGDHVIAVLGLESVESDPAATPLLFHLSRFVDFAIPAPA